MQTEYQFSPEAETMHALAGDPEYNEWMDEREAEARADRADEHAEFLAESRGDDGDDVSECEGDEPDADDGEPMGSFDCSDDAEALASAGFGTDEDYGCYGGEDSYLDASYEDRTEMDFGE